MTKKQFRKADSMVFPTVLVVMIGIFLNILGMAATKGGTPQLYVVIAASVIGVIVDTIVYIRMKGTRMCGLIMPAVASMVYILMVLFVDAVFFYMLAAAIFVIDMAYLEFKRITGKAVVIVPIFVIKTLYLGRIGTVSTTEAGTTVVIMIFILIVVLAITRVWVIFNEENMSTVRAGADKQREAADRMSHVSENIVTYFDEAGGYVKELTNALDTSNSSMKNIAASIENTTLAIQEQSQKCQDIQDNTHNAKEQTDIMIEASGRALEEVSQGAKAMEELHNQAQNVEKDNKETVAYVVALNERTKEVENILNTIVNISSQTNLLALNASIEAARAGEAGKGFAVVADEIRELSEQTKRATENITDILTELNRDVESVTVSINHSVETMGQQNSLIEETKSKFDAIESGVNELMDVIHSFKQVINDITDSAEGIANGITGVSANSEEVAAASNEGTELMTRAVDDMGKVNTALTNIYQMAQHLQQE